MRNPLRRRSAPEVRAVSSLPWTADAPNHSGTPVNAQTAMQHDAAWACVDLVATICSTLPVDVVRGAGAAASKLTTLPPVVQYPSLRGLDRREWLYQGVASLVGRGEAVGFVTAFDAAARPAAVEWLDPACLDVYEPSSLTVPEYFIDGQAVSLVQHGGNLIHLRDRTAPGSVRGLSPIEYHAETLGMGLAAKKFGSQWFGQGAHPSAILTTDQRVDPEQAKAMKERFLASIRGKREPAVLGAGITYTPIQVSAEESQFLATIGANATQIARIYRVPAEMIGASVEGSGLTYANREQRWQDFLNISILPRLVKFEDLLSAMIARPQSVKFNLGGLMRADLLTRYQAHKLGIDAGFLLRSEARAYEDLPAVDGIDDAPAPAPAPAPAAGGSADAA